MKCYNGERINLSINFWESTMSVKKRLSKFILTDGFHLTIDTERSQGSWLVDKETGKRYLDCYSQFASQALGWNHPSLLKYESLLGKVALHKIANSDMYSEVYADFVEEFATITRDFKYYFFIEGGALAVENCLKIAFDYKCQIDPKFQENDGQDLDVIHLQQAFHGRTGYTLGMLGTGELKTKWFPKFKWTRVLNPKLSFPVNKDKVAEAENISISQMINSLEKGNVAAIIMETIQGEGGDSFFRNEYFKKVRELADKYNALLIFDEVQAGMGVTGKWWAYQNYDVKPDMISFGKKSQVCGVCCSERIDQAKNHSFKQSGRINSTWGSNTLDMARATAIIKIMKEENILVNARNTGNYFLEKLKTLENNEVTNVRGMGLMLAFDLPNAERRDEVIEKLHEDMMILKCGDRSIRLRPHLTFTKENVDCAIQFIQKALK